MTEKRFALIIGNSKYEDTSLAQLVTPGADSVGLAAVLQASDIGGFNEVQTLVNEPFATIYQEVAHFFAAKKRDDLLLLYFSGHGVLDDQGRLFLAVRNTRRDLLRGTAIPAAFITDEMDHSNSRRQVLILDCCHSGAFARGTKGVVGASVGTAAAFEGTGYGRAVLTATDSTQYAWEGDRVIGHAENSVFTHYLIKGLQTGEADTDGDGRITLDELSNYVYEQVVTQTSKQTPRKWSYNQQGEIIIARNPRPIVKSVDLPPELQQAIGDNRPWVREGAVLELGRLLQGNHYGLALAAHEALSRLVDDDSRRVSAAAAACLAAYAETPRAKEQVQGVRAHEPKRAEAVRGVVQKTEGQRIDHYARPVVQERQTSGAQRLSSMAMLVRRLSGIPLWGRLVIINGIVLGVLRFLSDSILFLPVILITNGIVLLLHKVRWFSVWTMIAAGVFYFLVNTNLLAVGFEPFLPLVLVAIGLPSEIWYRRRSTK